MVGNTTLKIAKYQNNVISNYQNPFTCLRLN